MKTFDRFPLVNTLLVLKNDEERHQGDPSLYPPPDETAVYCRIDLRKVESYRQILDSESKVVESQVYVKMQSGDFHHLDMSFEEFDELYMRYVESIM